MSKVRIQLNRRGVGQLLKSPELAQGLASLAFGAQHRLGPGYEAVYYTAPTRAVAEVRAQSPAACKENADTNTILKALK